MTVAELIEVLRVYPGDLEVELFTFNKPDLAPGWWSAHPVEDVDWADPTHLRINAQD